MRFFGAWEGELAFPPYDPYELLYRHTIGLSALARREVFADTGGFDPSFQQLEDWELWVHALARGWRGRQVDAVTVEYRRHEASKHWRDRRSYRQAFRRLRAKHLELYHNPPESRLGPARTGLVSAVLGLQARSPRSSSSPCTACAGGVKKHRRTADKGGMRKAAIVPAYNEARSIAGVVAELHATHPEFEVVVVDDGSTDATAAVARRAGAEVVQLPFNLGIGGAVQTGIEWARRRGCEVAVQVDGDGQHDPREIAKILGPILAGSGRRRRRHPLRR